MRRDLDCLLRKDDLAGLTVCDLDIDRLPIDAMLNCAGLRVEPLKLHR
jgi:hypothetical protein